MSAVTQMTPHLLEQAGVVADGDQYADSTALVLEVDSIIVADRYRKVIGDVSDLKDSIENVGLLNPITVREWHGGYRLVAGERRLTAFKQLGLTTIDARLARDIGDARDALVAERDENTARKPMLPTEAAALGMAIEEMEKPAAMERMREGRNQWSVPSAPGSRGQAAERPRDIAAEAAGLSRATYVQIKTAITTAANEEEPEEVREVARDVLEKIDAGEPIRPNVERIKEIRRKSESVNVGSNKPAPERDRERRSEVAEYVAALAQMHPTCRIAYEADGHTRYANESGLGDAANRLGITWQYTERQWRARVETSRDVLDRSSLAINVALDAIDIRVDMTTITPEQATEALERLNASALNRIIKQLKEISNG